jgi:prefoldin subunit 5
MAKADVIETLEMLIERINELQRSLDSVESRLNGLEVSSSVFKKFDLAKFPCVRTNKRA